MRSFATPLPVIFLVLLCSLFSGCKESSIPEVPIALNSEPPLLEEFESVLSAVNSVLETSSPTIPLTRITPAAAQTHLTSIRENIATGQFEAVDAQLDSFLQQNVHIHDGRFFYDVIIADLISAPNAETWNTESVHNHVVVGFIEVDKAWAARRSRSFRNEIEAGEEWSEFQEHLSLGAEAYRKGLAVSQTNPALLNLWADLSLGKGLNIADVPLMAEIACNLPRPSGEMCWRLPRTLLPRWHGTSSDITTFLNQQAHKWPDSAQKLEGLIKVIAYAARWGERKELLSHTQTIETFNQIIDKMEKLWPRSDWAYASICSTLFANDVETLGSSFLEEGLAKFPNSTRLLTEKGRMLARQDNHAQATNLFTKALSFTPSDMLANCAMSNACSRLALHESSAKYARAALQQMKRAELWRRSLMMINLGKDHRSKGESEEALDMFEQAKMLKYGPRSLRYFGMALAELNRLPEAKEAFNEALELDPSQKEWIDARFPGWEETF